MPAPHSTAARAVGYARVSDDRQSTLPHQKCWIAEAAGRAGLDVVEVVEDDGLSGDDPGRPGLAAVERALARAKERGRPVTVLLAEYADRVSRANSRRTFAVY